MFWKWLVQLPTALPSPLPSSPSRLCSCRFCLPSCAPGQWKASAISCTSIHQYLFTPWRLFAHNFSREPWGTRLYLLLKLFGRLALPLPLPNPGYYLLLDAHPLLKVADLLMQWDNFSFYIPWYWHNFNQWKAAYAFFAIVPTEFYLDRRRQNPA